MTVVWAIALIVVNAIQRAVIRSWAHVGQEVLKTVPPAVANRDAATTVVSEIYSVGVAATLPHRLPNVVFGMAIAPVPSRSPAAILAMQAAA